MDNFLNYFLYKINELNTENKPILVIGNSPDVLKKKIGEEIDNNYFVIRFNKGCNITEEYKNFVGTRTDIKVFCSFYFTKFIIEDYIKNKLSGDGTIITIFGNPKKIINDLKINNLKCYVLSDKVNNSIIKNEYNITFDLKKNCTSSGLLIVYYLLKLFDTIYVYGFSHSNKHFYPNRYNNNSPRFSHSYDFEKKVFETFEELGKIKKL